MVVFEYVTTSEYDSNSRILGWYSWDTDLYPEKSIFEQNSPPNSEMGALGALNDEDRLPQFVLFADGHIEKQKVNENIKKTMYKVMKARFDKDYGEEQVIEIVDILATESGSTDPKVKEFQRRKKEVDDLKV